MNNNNYGGHDPANDPARKAMEAARRAREHANQAKLEAEREDRLRRDQARENIPLVSPHKDQVQKRDQKSGHADFKLRVKMDSRPCADRNLHPVE